VHGVADAALDLVEVVGRRVEGGEAAAGGALVVGGGALVLVLAVADDVGREVARLGLGLELAAALRLDQQARVALGVALFFLGIIGVVLVLIIAAAAAAELVVVRDAEAGGVAVVAVVVKEEALFGAALATRLVVLLVVLAVLVVLVRLVVLVIIRRAVIIIRLRLLLLLEVAAAVDVAAAALVGVVLLVVLLLLRLGPGLLALLLLLLGRLEPLGVGVREPLAACLGWRLGGCGGDLCGMFFRAGRGGGGGGRREGERQSERDPFAGSTAPRADESERGRLVNRCARYCGCRPCLSHLARSGLGLGSRGGPPRRRRAVEVVSGGGWGQGERGGEGGGGVVSSRRVARAREREDETGARAPRMGRGLLSYYAPHLILTMLFVLAVTGVPRAGRSAPTNRQEARCAPARYDAS
jgi:hypothetical protein